MSARFYLLILDGERKGEKVPLEGERFTIGRKEKNDLVLQDPRVSGYHAEVVLEGGNWILRDLGSTNGTFLDGRRVEEVPLEHGDTFSVGVLRLRFVDAEGGPLAEESQEVQVARVDREVLEKAGRKRSLTPLVLLLVLALGAGTWAFLRVGGPGKGGAKGKKPLETAGNLLPLQAASFEEGGFAFWDGKAGRGVFDLEPGEVHSGEMAAAAELEKGKPALLVQREPFPAQGGDAFRAGAFFRIEGEARAALHLVFHAGDPSLPLLSVSTPWVDAGRKKGFTQVALEGTVPRGCRSVSLEVAAVGASGRVLVDDVFLVSSPKGPSLEIRIPEYPGAAVLFSGAFFSVFQGDAPRLALLGPVLLPRGGEEPDREALLLASRLWGAAPDGSGAELAGFEGERVRVETRTRPGEEGVQVEWKAAPGGPAPVLAWFLAPGLQEAEIPSRDGKGVRALRLKTRTDAVLLAWDAPFQVRRLPGPGGRSCGWTDLPSGPVNLKVGFRKDWVLGKSLLRKAAQARDEGKPGLAMNYLRRLMEEVPYNEKDLEEARLLYGKLLEKGRRALEELKTASEKAALLMAPAELEAVARRAASFAAEYKGEESLCAEAEKIRAEMKGLLEGILAKEREKERKRLQGVLDSLDPKAKALRKLVEDYIGKYLGPAPSGKE